MMKARKHGTMSQLLHIIFRLSTPSEECRPLLKDFHFLPSVRNDRHALNTAQLQVLMEYGILHHGRGPPVALQANIHPYLELVCYSFIFTQSTMLTSCTASKMWQWPWRYYAHTGFPYKAVLGRRVRLASSIRLLLEVTLLAMLHRQLC